MARRRLPDPVTLEVSALDQRLRGLARYEERTCHVRGALPGERVEARVTGRERRDWALRTTRVLEAAAERVDPRCPHVDECSACAIQHAGLEAQRGWRQQRLAAAFSAHELEPATWLAPLAGPAFNYRRKARLSVREVPAKGRVLVGFREHNGRYVADLRECHVLDRRIGTRLVALGELIAGLGAPAAIPQLEVACGDERAAVVVRHLEPLTASDRDRIAAFGAETDLAFFLQPGGEETVGSLTQPAPRLSYALPEFEVELEFQPTDFIQVNGELNRAMVGRAVEYLDPGPGDRVLDLFCGLGNFTLPLARRAGRVLGVEGDERLVARGRANAAANGIDHADFAAADLYRDGALGAAAAERWDLALLDPPRSGAGSVLPALAATGVRRVLYISCHPESLAADAAALVTDLGFTLASAGILDMFPHTTHVEAMAVFER